MEVDSGLTTTDSKFKRRIKLVRMQKRLLQDRAKTLLLDVLAHYFEQLN
jgi:hypothetical protein